MYLALILNNTVSVYPYGLVQFKQENPNVSLPIEPTEEQLNEQNIYIVHPKNKPVYDPVREACIEVTPIFTDRWEQSWNIKPLTDSEIEANIETRWTEIRSERDSLLSKCDWTQLPDVPFVEEDKQKWAIYRQELRDITSQEDPFNIVWPTNPDEVNNEVI